MLKPIFPHISIYNFSSKYFIALNVVAELICEILKTSPVTIDELSRSLLLPSSRVRDLMANLIKIHLLSLKNENEKLIVEPIDKLKLALYAIQQGANVKKVSLCLNWREFEEFCALAFRAYGYSVYRNFRFECNDRRFEIDVIGVKKPLILCVDCKRWSAGRFSVLHKNAINHFHKVERLSACSNALHRLGVLNWDAVLLLPVMLTVHEDKVKVYDGTPIVPVFKFNSFLSEFEAFICDLKLIKIKKN